MSSMGSARTAWRAIVVIIVALAAAVAIGIVPRLEQKAARARVAAERAGPRRVRVATVQQGQATVEVTLPGTSSPMRSSVLYSKSTGFVRQNLVDIGDRVEAGQVLAEIEAPETEEEIRLARARLAEAQANVGLFTSTSTRLLALAAKGGASRREADDALAQANSASAAVAIGKADLKRLEVLRGYQKIVAPFAGIVTQRLTDPGTLVGPQGAGGSAMFEIADANTLRVVVDVPDAYASDVKPDVEAAVFSPRDPGRTVTGKVTRTSGVLEQRTRTLRAEVHVHGGDVVLPGAFVYVRLSIPRAHPAPVAPASALLVRKEGTLVAKVEDGRIALVPVQIGRDFGKEVELVEGVAPGDTLVVPASDDLEHGQMVAIMEGPHDSSPVPAKP